MVRTLVLNHRGLGETMMSLPACRWLSAESTDELWMTLSGPEESVCRNQRCGDRFIPFVFSKSSPLRLATVLWKMHRLNFERVIALYGFEPLMVAYFSRLIGAHYWLCHSIDQRSFFDRNTIHKRDRHLRVIEDYLGKSAPTGCEQDYFLETSDKRKDACSLLSNPYIVLVPGSGELERFKRWPTGEFKSFAKIFLEKFPNMNVAVVGSAHEAYLAGEIIAESNDPRIFNLCGHLSLPELTGVFRRSRLVVGADSGGMHLAKASHARVVVIMGPTNNALTGPINADLVIDDKLPGTPWYCRDAVRKRAFSTSEPSMQIPADRVFETILGHGLL